MRRSLFVVTLILALTITEVRAQLVPLIDTIAGSGEDYPGDGGPATQAELSGPVNVHVASDGTVYIVDWSDQVIRTVSPSGTISLFAGDYNAGFLGDEGPATLAQLNSPTDIVDDGAGNVYIADGGNNRIRKVDASGTITTVAGTGISGHSGDGGPATLAMMDNPSGLAFDPSGNLFFGDYGNHVIRRIDMVGVITTVAGTPTVSGFSGDGGPATLALLEYPTGVTTDTEGGVYFTEESNHTIRKITTNGTLVRIAGTGNAGFSGDNGPATQADLSLWWPTGLDVDHLGNVFVTDTFNNRVRRVNTDGFISTVAGSGSPGYDGDGGPATLASLNQPMGLDVDSDGNIYFPEWSNSSVRKVSALPSTDVQLHISEAFGRPGDLATVNLTVTSGIPIGGLEMAVLPELQFSESNAPLTPGSEPVVLEGIINDLENEGVSVFHSTDPSTSITTILVVSINGEEIGPGSRPVLELVYRIDDQIAPASRIHIEVDDVLVSSPEATVLTHTTFPGFIQVGRTGDLAGGNHSGGDGAINILDIVRLINYILEILPEPPIESFAFWTTDINEDGAIDVRDLVGVIQQALAEDSAEPMTKSVSPASATTVTIGIGAVVTDRTGQQYIPVYLTSDGAVDGIQFSLNADPTTMLLGVPALTGRADHMQIQHHQDAGTLRMVVYSMDGKVLPEGATAVVMIPVRIIDDAHLASSATLEGVVISNHLRQAVPVTVADTGLKRSSGPLTFSLMNNAPNPFNPATVIVYEVPEPARISIIVYNLLGQEIARLVDQHQTPGRYQVLWDSRNARGSQVTSGIYLYRMQSSTGFVQTRRMTLLK